MSSCLDALKYNKRFFLTSTSRKLVQKHLLTNSNFFYLFVPFKYRTGNIQNILWETFDYYEYFEMFRPVFLKPPTNQSKTTNFKNKNLRAPVNIFCITNIR